MNQESSESSGKPVLNAESFQRLLAAAYLLQGQSDRTRNDQAHVHPPVAERTRTFAAGAIVQRRTQGRTPHFSVQRQSAPVVKNISPTSQIAEAQHAAYPVVSLRYAGRPIPVVRHLAPQSKAALWRAVDALAISAVFLAIVGVSIHGLWASRGPLQMSSGMLSLQAARPAAEVLASSHPTALQASGRSLEPIEADGIAEDTVIRYPARVVDSPARAAKKPRNASTLAAGLVVRYGPDVKTWKFQKNGNEAGN